MNWEAVGAVGEMLGAAIVIVSLIVLALELRQANQIARFTASRQLMRRFDEINTVLLKDRSLRELLSKTDELNDDEEERLHVFADFLVNVWISIHEASINRLIKPDVFQAMMKDVEISLVRWPQIRRAIELRLSRYPETRGYYQVFDTVFSSKSEASNA